mgnify:CR=1 FL=1
MRPPALRVLRVLRLLAMQALAMRQLATRIRQAALEQGMGLIIRLASLIEQAAEQFKLAIVFC